MWYPYLINMSMCPFVLYPYLRRASKYTHMYVARSCNKKKDVITTSMLDPSLT